MVIGHGYEVNYQSLALRLLQCSWNVYETIYTDFILTRLNNIQSIIVLQLPHYSNNFQLNSCW